MSKSAFIVTKVSDTDETRGLADILDAFSTGIAQGAPLIIVYLFAIQLYESLRFVFNL